MTIKLKYFGLIAEGIGKAEELKPMDSQNVSELKTALEQEHLVLQSTPYRIAINSKLASPNELLNEGDEVALLPPFAGG